MIHFDPTITTGDLLTVVAMTISIFFAYHKIILRIEKLEFRTGMMWRRSFPEFNVDEENG